MKERIEVLLSAEQIDKRMAELADELYQEFVCNHTFHLSQTI